MSLAEEVMVGEVCANCFMPFVQNHGYLVHCSDCYDEDSASMGCQKAIHLTVIQEEDRVKKCREHAYTSRKKTTIKCDKCGFTNKREDFAKLKGKVIPCTRCDGQLHVVDDKTEEQKKGSNAQASKNR